MTAGIAVSVKSNLGVSPVSSIPYTITCVFGMEMGNATILFHVVLVLLQILLLRKNFKWINLCQVVVGIIFGKFTTLCNSLVALLPSTDNMLIRLGMMLISVVLIAVGIFFYLRQILCRLQERERCRQYQRSPVLYFQRLRSDLTAVWLSYR